MKRIVFSAALTALLLAGCSQSNAPGVELAAAAPAQAPAPRVVCEKQRVVHKEEWTGGGAVGAAVEHVDSSDQELRVSYVEHCRDVSMN